MHHLLYIKTKYENFPCKCLLNKTCVGHFDPIDGIGIEVILLNSEHTFVHNTILEVRNTREPNHHDNDDDELCSYDKPSGADSTVDDPPPMDNLSDSDSPTTDCQGAYLHTDN